MLHPCDFGGRSLDLLLNKCSYWNIICICNSGRHDYSLAFDGLHFQFHAIQKFIHAISPTPASSMSKAELSTKPSNTTLSPYVCVDKTSQTEGSAKRPGDSTSDSQYWRYDASQKRQKHGDGNGDRLCFKFVSSGSCPRGQKCHFRHDEEAMEQYMRGVCFDFLNKGKCERGPDCKFKHNLQDESDMSRSKAASSTRCIYSNLLWNHIWSQCLLLLPNFLEYYVYGTILWL